MEATMIRDSVWWIEEYQKRKAFWLHDENPKRPHALLTSRMHSNGFFNSKEIITNETLLRLAASDLMDQFGPAFICQWLVQGIVGPQTGATKLAELLSKEINGRRSESEEKNCFWASPAKASGDKKEMIFSQSDIEKISGSNVLLCEDVVTTGSSIQLTEDALHKAKGNAHCFIITLVNRSGQRVVNGKIIIPLIDKPMQIWTPSTCPLCMHGSEAIRPKEGQNWEKLNAQY